MVKKWVEDQSTSTLRIKSLVEATEKNYVVLPVIQDPVPALVRVQDRKKEGKIIFEQD